MSSFKRIRNIRELQSEKGLYYPYLMQIMGCPVIQGVLIPETSLKYLYANHVEGIFQTLLDIYTTNPEDPEDHSNKLFPVISKSEFVHSMTWAIADCFYDGCDPEDFDEEKIFSFFNKEERYRVNPEDNWNPIYDTKLKYVEVLSDLPVEYLS